MPGQAFNNILYTRRFNALKQITGDLRKTKPLLKEKNDIFAKEAQFLFGERFESDIIRTAKSKQKSNEVFSAMTKKQQPFRRVPSWNTNKIKKGIKEICTVSVGRDSLQVPLSLFWSRSSSSNIYQNFKGTNFALEKASDSCDNISGRHVTRATDTRRVINEQRYNNFSSDSIGICNQFEKVYPSANPTNRISWLGDRFCRNETIFFSKKGGGDCSDVSKCNGRQFDFKGFDQVTGEIDPHNSSDFTSETSDSFPATDANAGPENKHELKICDHSGPAGEREAAMVDNQHVIVPPDLTIFSDASKKDWGATCQEITTGGRWSSVEKSWHINVLELEAVRLAILSFTKFKKLNLIHLRTDNITALSYLLNMRETQNKHLIKISKEIWGYLIERRIYLTAEYIPSLSNETADRASRIFQDSSE